MTSPEPLTKSSVPSLENLALTPGDADMILSWAFSSKPLVASSSYLILFPLSLTSNPEVEELPVITIGNFVSLFGDEVFPLIVCVAVATACTLY